MAEQSKRAVMKFDMVNSVVSDDDQERSEFRVGNYTLQLHRSCDKTRKHLRLSQREFELLMWIGAGLKKARDCGSHGRYDRHRRYIPSPRLCETWRKLRFSRSRDHLSPFGRNRGRGDYGLIGALSNMLNKAFGDIVRIRIRFGEERL